MRKQPWWAPGIQLGSTHHNLLRLAMFTYQETDKEHFTRLFFFNFSSARYFSWGSKEILQEITKLISVTIDSFLNSSSLVRFNIVFTSLCFA